MTATDDLVELLRREGIDCELLSHARTERAAEEAEALGMSPQEVAKTLVVATAEGYVRAVVPAASRLSLAKIRDVLGSPKKQTHLATEEALGRDYPEFELGAVPPFGGARSHRVLIDHGVAEQESVVVEAGSHVASLRLRAADLINLTRAEVVDIAED
jgi:Ala-tRNA(Pro) deacylase